MTSRTPALHTLKIKHQYLSDISLGLKTFELRKNDRDYQVGDVIQFLDIDHDLSPYKTLYGIVYILKDVPYYGLDPDYCILGIRKLTEIPPILLKKINK